MNLGDELINATQSFAESVPLYSKIYVYNDDGTEVKFDLDSRVLERGLPEFDTEKSVHFTLHTTKNRKGVEVNLFKGENLEKMGYNSSRPTVVITHGWMNTHRAPACNLVKEGL